MKKATRLEILNSILSELQTVIPAKEGKHYAIDFAATYGGYRLVLVDNNSGAHYGCFGGNGCEARIKYDAMLNKLNTIIATAKLIKGN